METLVEVSFHLSSDKTNMHEIERLIGIYPCRTRTEFPKGSIAVPFWCIERQVKCLDFETAFYVLFDEIKDKQDTIIELCKRYEIVPTVMFVVRITYSHRPDMTITPQMMKFLTHLQAELIIYPIVVSDDEVYNTGDGPMR